MSERKYATGEENLCVDFSVIPSKFKLLFHFGDGGRIRIYKNIFSSFPHNMHWHLTFLTWRFFLWIAKFLFSILFCDTSWTKFSVWRQFTCCLATVFQIPVAMSVRVLSCTFYSSIWRIQCSTRDRLVCLKSEYLTYWTPLSLSLSVSIALQSFGPWPLFQFLNPIHSRSPWMEDQPVARLLPTHRTTQTQD
jgi:hypothetical protein